MFITRAEDSIRGLIRSRELGDEYGRAAPRDFPRAKPEGNPEEQPCQPEENPVLPDSFTQIYILFLIGFRIGPPKMHRRFRIGLPKIHRRFRIGPPKIHRRFRIGPPQVTLNLLLPEFHSRWILVYHGYYVRKATKLPIWNRMLIISFLTIIYWKLMHQYYPDYQEYFLVQKFQNQGNLCISVRRVRVYQVI